MTDRPVMLVTGASRGIGAALAGHFAARGYAVVGCSRSTIAAPEYDRHLVADVTDESAVRALVATIRREHGRLDALINNAAVAGMNHALTTPLASVRAMFDTNAVGTFLCSREAARLMRRRPAGRIVNLTSPAVPWRLAGESAYAASKAAIESLTRTLAFELAEFGITVNAVGPAPTPTDLLRGVGAERLDRLLERQAIRRPGRVEDVINVVDFFLRAESDFVTGQVVYLGGVS